MQSTELDPTLAQTLDKAGKDRLTLVIANKNYSSWSMRPWVVLKAFGIPFQEIQVRLGEPDTASQIASYTASGRVPVLLHGDMVIWDSLAICEYLAEQFPDKHMWPTNVAARAMARSMCAEMHAGFADLRQAMWMNIRANFAGKGRTAGAQADIGRISELWEDCLSQFGHHEYLFGDFSIADAYYAPVVMRFATYDVALAPALQAYCERVKAHPAVAEWITAAREEPFGVAKYDTHP
ncbi:glutathione S-transferase [Paucimonas lemoignei]|uniref:Glutathione S-transferase n=1 Tax=Paucimonas lemoignei TaxID=29443 RepID=A0A4R3HZI2_PAULE|nr:glutathione S-transferase family protein [Paucimonas lemoignei]TCS37761.1 glutathione S-transferase [Paucimonas lemoignei]